MVLVMRSMNCQSESHLRLCEVTENQLKNSRSDVLLVTIRVKQSKHYVQYSGCNHIQTHLLLQYLQVGPCNRIIMCVSYKWLSTEQLRSIKLQLPHTVHI